MDIGKGKEIKTALTLVTGRPNRSLVYLNNFLKSLKQNTENNFTNYVPKLIKTFNVHISPGIHFMNLKKRYTLGEYTFILKSFKLMSSISNEICIFKSCFMFSISLHLYNQDFLL